MAQITLRSAHSIKNQDEVESLAAALTAALKLKQSHAGTALKLAVQLGEAQSKAATATDEAFKCSQLPFTQVRSPDSNWRERADIICHGAGVYWQSRIESHQPDK